LSDVSRPLTGLFLVSQAPPRVEPAPWSLRGNATAIFFQRGILAFVRYTESNVGAYDELLWLAPFQRSPAGRAHQVPAIFVSSEASARSGRCNWGLPKELAQFRVVVVGADTEAVQVTRAGQPVASFVRRRPRASLPIELGWFPEGARRLLQVYEGRSFDTVPEGRARFRLTQVSELEVNRQLLPQARSSRRRLGIDLSPFELLFPAARIVELR
jgi:hypothetical protein